MRTQLYRGVGFIGLRLSEAVEQLPFRENVSLAQDGEKHMQEQGLLVHAPLEVRNGLLEGSYLPPRLVQRRAVGR
jgi:hypothetical protein